MEQEKILVVDDDIEITRVVRIRLAAAGIASDVAHSAEQAMALMSQKLYGVVVTDIHMPGLSGIELISALKRNNPLTQIIMLTSDTTMRSVVECIERGAVDFFSKTGDLLHLVEAASAALGRVARWRASVGNRATPQVAAAT